MYPIKEPESLSLWRFESLFCQCRQNYLETTDGVHGMTICHYPLLAWKNAGRTYMVHGHIHADTNSDYWPLIQRRERVLNAGVDVNDYRSVTFEEMVENNRKFKAAHA